MLAELAPREPEVHGLVALMEIQASRLRARTSPRGEPVLLLDQDRARWDRLLIRRGLAALARAEALGGGFGPYTLQAAIAACHARARTAEDDRLGADRRALRRARRARRRRRWWSSTARSRWRWRSGPAAGLEVVDALARRAGAPPATTCSRASAATCCAKLGRADEARAELKHAAALTRNERERALLLERAAALVA